MVSRYPQGYHDFMKHFIKPALPFWKGPRGDGEFLCLWKWGFSLLEDNRENSAVGQHLLLCRGLGLYRRWWWVELRSLSRQLSLQHRFSFFLTWILFLLLQLGIVHRATENETDTSVFQEVFACNGNQAFFCFSAINREGRRRKARRMEHMSFFFFAFFSLLAFPPLLFLFFRCLYIYFLCS